jgi:hypothetical protein
MTRAFLRSGTENWVLVLKEEGWKCNQGVGRLAEIEFSLKQREKQNP